MGFHSWSECQRWQALILVFQGISLGVPSAWWGRPAPTGKPGFLEIERRILFWERTSLLCHSAFVNQKHSSNALKASQSQPDTATRNVCQRLSLFLRLNDLIFLLRPTRGAIILFSPPHPQIFPYNLGIFLLHFCLRAFHGNPREQYSSNQPTEQLSMSSSFSFNKSIQILLWAVRIWKSWPASDPKVTTSNDLMFQKHFWLNYWKYTRWWELTGAWYL